MPRYMDTGVVESTTLGYEDHGLFIAQICLDFGGGSHQCIQACLEEPDIGPFVTNILRVANVDEWEQLIGVRLTVHRDVPYGYITAVSNGPRYYRWGG